MSHPPPPDGDASTNPGMRVRPGRDFHPETVDERIEAAGPLMSPNDGTARLVEHDLGGLIPREEANWRTFRSAEIYVQLETTIYGPISQADLTELLRSGQLTGYETASNDLQHWTPLLYHPLMVVRSTTDIDEGHAVLQGRSTLPTASGRKRSLLEDLADGDLSELEREETADPPASMPLAAIMIKPKRVAASKATGRELPVYGEIRETSSGRHIERSAPGTTAPLSPRPPHPADAASDDDPLEFQVDEGPAPLPPRMQGLEGDSENDGDLYQTDQFATVDEDGEATQDNEAVSAESPAAADPVWLPPTWLLLILLALVIGYGAWLLLPRLL